MIALLITIASLASSHRLFSYKHHGCSVASFSYVLPQNRLEQNNVKHQGIFVFHRNDGPSFTSIKNIKPLQATFNLGEREDSNKKSKAPRGVPTLSKWKLNKDGSITGIITGSDEYKDGQRINTGNLKSGVTIKTSDGSRFYLETPEQTAARTSTEVAEKKKETEDKKQKQIAEALSSIEDRKKDAIKRKEAALTALEAKKKGTKDKKTQNLKSGSQNLSSGAQKIESASDKNERKEKEEKEELKAQRIAALMIVASPFGFYGLKQSALLPNTQKQYDSLESSKPTPPFTLDSIKTNVIQKSPAGAKLTLKSSEEKVKPEGLPKSVINFDKLDDDSDIRNSQEISKQNVEGEISTELSSPMSEKNKQLQESLTFIKSEASDEKAEKAAEKGVSTTQTKDQLQQRAVPTKTEQKGTTQTSVQTPNFVTLLQNSVDKVTGKLFKKGEKITSSDVRVLAAISTSLGLFGIGQLTRFGQDDSYFSSNMEMNEVDLKEKTEQPTDMGAKPVQSIQQVRADRSKSEAANLKAQDEKIVAKTAAKSEVISAKIGGEIEDFLNQESEQRRPDLPKSEAVNVKIGGEIEDFLIQESEQKKKVKLTTAEAKNKEFDDAWSAALKAAKKDDSKM